MEQEWMEQMESFCEDYGYAYRDDYSGRGMYGNTCVGITCDNPVQAAMELMAYLADSIEPADALDILGTPQVDSMGCSQILYFPHLRT